MLLSLPRPDRRRPPATRPARRTIPHLEALETREVPNAAPGGEHLEQWMLYLLNRARSNPAVYQQEAGLAADLSRVAPRQPLALNAALTASGRARTGEMAAYNYFEHRSAVTGQWPNQVARAAGYPLPASMANTTNSIESIAAGYSDAPTMLRMLIQDDGIPDLGHRLHLLGMTSFHAAAREVGVGYASNAASTYHSYWAIHTGYVSASDTFLTGVVYSDANSNARYDPGEGLGGVQVSAGGQATTTTIAGGWSLKVAPNRRYTVTASGGAFRGATTTVVSVAGLNVEVDFLSGQAGAQVNFVPTAPAVPEGLGTVATALARSDEGHALFVKTVYQQYLGRAPDAPGLAFWVGQFRQGMREEALEALLVSLPEYAAGRGNAAWIGAIYQDLLGRTVDEQGAAFWTRRLADGMRPFDVALAVAGSTEHKARWVAADFRTFLGRAPSAAESTYWADTLVRGMRRCDFVSLCAASAEYYQRQGRGSGDVTAWVRSVYRDVLQRSATDGEVAVWLGALAGA